MEGIVEKELCDTILGCGFRVYNGLGSGFLEKVYRNAMAHDLRKVGLRVEVEKPVAVFYDGVCVGEYYADIVVNGRVLLELKACSEILPIHEAQLLHYLKATGIEVGYVLNFGSAGKLEYRRMVWTSPGNRR